MLPLFSLAPVRLALISIVPLYVAAQPANLPPSITGAWSSSEVRSVQFKDRATGAFAKPSGAIITYHISPDGQYRKEALIQTSMYNCSDVVFATESGRVFLDDGKLVFASTGGKLNSQDNCNARFNYSKQLAPKRYVYSQWLLRDGQAGPELCMADEKTHLCYRRKN